MNLVDSSAWLEYFANGPDADYFAKAIEDTESLIVSTVNIYEVFNRILQQKSDSDALQAVVLMQQATVIDVTTEIAVLAAKLSIQEELPLTDSIILATARSSDATLWTQDADFDGKPNVNYRAKR